MFQKYKIIDANTKHSIFLQSVHLASSKRVLIHKILDPDPDALKKRLVKESQNPNSIVVTEYFQSEHALFVILQEAYLLVEACRGLDVRDLVEVFLEMLALSMQNIKLYENRLFLQRGRLKLYCLGGLNESVSSLYTPPELQYRNIGGAGQKEASYIWNLGVVYLNCLTAEVREQDYNKKYKLTVRKLQQLINSGSKFQPVYHLVKCMLKYPPSERISWSILQHSLMIVLEKCEHYRPPLSRHVLGGSKPKPGSYQPHLIRGILNEDPMSRTKQNRQSFINKSAPSIRRLKSSKSGMTVFPSNFPYGPTKNKSLLRTDTKTTFKTVNYKQLVQKAQKKEQKFAPARSFLELIQLKRLKAKESQSFLIKNQPIASLNGSLNSINVTQVLQEHSSMTRKPHFSTFTSTQTTKRPSVKRNQKTEASDSNAHYTQVESSKKQIANSTLILGQTSIQQLGREPKKTREARPSRNRNKSHEPEKYRKQQLVIEQVLQAPIQDQVVEQGSNLPQELDQLPESLTVIPLSGPTPKVQEPTLCSGKLQTVDRSERMPSQVSNPKQSSIKQNGSVIDQIKRKKSQKAPSQPLKPIQGNSQASKPNEPRDQYNSPTSTNQQLCSQKLRRSESIQYGHKKVLRAINLLGEVVKHANQNLKTQRNKWMLYCFLIYKCYWSFRLKTVQALRDNKKIENLGVLIQENDKITLGFNSMFNVVPKVAQNEDIYKLNKDLVNTNELSGDWRRRYILILSNFFQQMYQVVTRQRVHLVAKGRFKVTLKFLILIGVSVLIIDEYQSQAEEFEIVDCYTHLSIRLSETDDQDIIPESFTQGLSFKIQKVLAKYS